MRIAALTLVLAACGGSSGSNAVIKITSPTASQSVALGADTDKSVALQYTVTSFTISAQGTCGSNAACGHVHILIDGPACSGSGPYNNSSYSATTGTAKFALCPSASQTGNHTVAVELHDDQHNPIKDGSGNQVGDSVSITTH